MSDGKRVAHGPAEDVGALPSAELPTGDGTETLEMGPPPVRIFFPGDAVSARAALRRWSPPAPGAAPSEPRGSSAALRFVPPPGLRLMQVPPVRGRKSDR